MASSASTFAMSLPRAFAMIEHDVRELLCSKAQLLGLAKPPRASGVYLLSIDGEIKYVGEAKGGGGLYDRIVRKHLSGDDSHAIQRAFAVEFPDRLTRRGHIRNVVAAQWLEIQDHHRVSAVERMLIWMLNPAWNLK